MNTERLELVKAFSVGNESQKRSVSLTSNYLKALSIVSFLLDLTDGNYAITGSLALSFYGIDIGRDVKDIDIVVEERYSKDLIASLDFLESINTDVEKVILGSINENSVPSVSNAEKVRNKMGLKKTLYYSFYGVNVEFFIMEKINIGFEYITIEESITSLGILTHKKHSSNKVKVYTLQNIVSAKKWMIGVYIEQLNLYLEELLKKIKEIKDIHCVNIQRKQRLTNDLDKLCIKINETESKIIKHTVDINKILIFIANRNENNQS